MKTYFRNVMNTLERSVESMDVGIFEQLVSECKRVIESGCKIIVSGLGKNVPVCEKFVGTMNSLGLTACFMNTNSATHGDLGMVKPGDLVIVLTKSGETVESDLWLLSFQKESTLVREIPKHLILDLEHEGDPWNIMPNNSTTVNLIVLQGLAITLVERLRLQLSQFKENHPGGAIGEQLKDA